MAPRAVKEVLEIDEDHLAPLVEAIASLELVEGWINLTPGVPSNTVIEDRSLVSWFAGAQSVEAPLATWMPSAPGSTASGTLGVLHRRGRLHREGLAGMASIPSSWRNRQDHARRGLLFEVPETTPAELAEIMVSVVEELTTVTTTGRYLVEVFRRPARSVKRPV
jgi:hypothetical protein